MGRSAAGRALELPVEARGAALGAALGLYVAGGALALWAAARAVRRGLREGGEDGVFWALDLGGTNFRSVRVRLQKPVETSRQSGGAARSRSSILFGSKPMVQAREVPIPEELLTGTADALFDFMAKNLLAHAAKIA